MVDDRKVIARYALVSDIHANLAAFRKIQTEIEKAKKEQGFDGVFCLGDIIGYGPSPNQVLQEAIPFFDRIILGNHEIAVVTDNYDCLNPLCQASLQWTHNVIEMEHLKKLTEIFNNGVASFILRRQGNTIHFSHAVPDKKSHHHLYASQFLYSLKDLDQLFRHFKSRLLLVGHCHVPFCVRQTSQKNYEIFATSKKTVESYINRNEGNIKEIGKDIFETEVRHGGRSIQVLLHLSPDTIITQTIDAEQRIVVSLPSGGGISRANPDPRAGWSELTLYSDNWAELKFHRVEYDCIATYTAFYKSGMPYLLADKVLPFFFYWRFNPDKKKAERMEKTETTENAEENTASSSS